MEKVKSSNRLFNSMRNCVMGIICQLTLLLFSFISRTVFIEYLGKEYLGINGLYSNILSLLSLSELGVGNVLLFMLYKPISESNIGLITKYLIYFKKIYRYIALALFFMGMAVVPALQYVINSELPLSKLRLYYILFLLNSIVSYLLVYKSIYVDAQQKKYIITFVNTLVNIIKNIVQILVLIYWQSFEIYLLIQIFSTIMGNVIVSSIANKSLACRNTKIHVLSIKEKQVIKNKIKSTFIYKIGTLLINNTDNIIISIIINTATVGLYSNYVLITSSITGFLAIVNGAIFSSVGNLVAEECKKDIERSFYVFVYLYYLITTILSIGMFLCFNNFIELWIGSSYCFDTVVVFLICFKFYISNVSSPIWIFREASGLFEKVKYIMVIAAILNILFSIILGVKFGMAGIIVGSIISRLLTIFVYEPRILHKYLFESSEKKFWLTQVKYVIDSFIVFVMSVLCTYKIKSDLVGIVIKCVLVLIITILVFVILNIKDKSRNQVISIVKAKLYQLALTIRK